MQYFSLSNSNPTYGHDISLPIMHHIAMLQVPACSAPTSDETIIQPGNRYRMMLPGAMLTEYANGAADDYALQTGIVGAYRPRLDAAEIEAVDLSVRPQQCFVWDEALLNPVVRRSLQCDEELLCSQQNNRLMLINASLQAPEVRLCNNSQPLLTISPRFELEWATEAFASQLGLVQLVESTRTLQFENGGSLVLLDTETTGCPVLYLENAGDLLAIKPVCAFQQQGDKQNIVFSTNVSQSIPAEYQGKTVVSVSVLEKYTWYFMQNAAPEDIARHIWVPVHWPIVWGWSIRVQQRFDGVWDIFRKKLILPTPTTEAPALPRWQSNSLRCFSDAGNAINSTDKGIQ
jgi:hypothetical protein